MKLSNNAKKLIIEHAKLKEATSTNPTSSAANPPKQAYKTNIHERHVDGDGSVQLEVMTHQRKERVTSDSSESPKSDPEEQEPSLLELATTAKSKVKGDPKKTLSRANR